MPDLTPSPGRKVNSNFARVRLRYVFEPLPLGVAIQYTTGMRRVFPSLFRCIALLLLVTVTNAALAMAAYICPEQMVDRAVMQMVEGTPCPEMDREKPVHCAEHKAGTKVAVEFASSPTLAVLSIGFVIPHPRPLPPAILEVSPPGQHPEAGADPPYLATLRLRI